MDISYYVLQGTISSLIFEVSNEISMTIENTKAQMRKGILELCVLSIIAQQEAYPSDILNKLKEAKLIVVEGTMYPLLSRLKNADLLSYEWKESTAGPPRKYYSLTDSGQAFLKDLRVTWDQLHSAVSKTTATKANGKKTKTSTRSRSSAKTKSATTSK